MSDGSELLDENGNLEVCGEVVETETDPCIENPYAAGCQEPGNSPPIQSNPIPTEPFLAPYDTIQVGENELVSTTREISVFNRNLFFLNDRLLDSQDADQLRFSVRALWTRNDEKEFFMNRPDHITVEVGEEKFNSPTAATDPPKYWSGNLKILFKRRSLEYPAVLRDLNANMGQYGIPGQGYRKPKFLDTVFASPQPFFENEMENVHEKKINYS